MSIYFHEEDRNIPTIEQEKIIKSVEEFCSNFDKKSGDINFIYCSDEYLLEMNKKYLAHDYFTDVITFNYCEENFVSGDIFMSRDRIEDNSKKLEIEAEEEFVRVCAHGLLHLLGLKDDSDVEKEIMRRKEEEFIQITRNL